MERTLSNEIKRTHKALITIKISFLRTAYHDIMFWNWPRSTSHQTWAQNISFIRLFTQKQTKNGLLYFLSFWAENQNFVESKKQQKRLIRVA